MQNRYSSTALFDVRVTAFYGASDCDPTSFAVSIKALATLPTAFLAGVGGILGSRAFERWASANAISITPAIEVAIYAGFFLAPFLICVIGVDTKRWDPHYNWFGQAAKADVRRMWIRWAAYFVGSIAGYALT